MQRITIQPVIDFSELGRRWQALEQRAPAGFFRSWTFLGCLAEQRFAGAQLLAVTQDGHDVALALLGSGGGQLWLNQTGDAACDAVFIEHNGMLAAPEAAGGVADALRAAARGGGVALSGIDDATLESARAAGWVHVRQSRWAPCIALEELDRPYLETLSANARAQIRRSQRLYGPELALASAESLDQAQDWFTEMRHLHQRAWLARGQPGAFADPHMSAFHTALIARAFPLGQAELLRVTAGPRHVGTLYNLVADGRVHCYQSGFAYSGDAREKPGLCCHALSIAHYAGAGARTYDLLAGAERYKKTLAQGGRMLHWASLNRAWSAAGMVAASGPFLKKRTKKLLSFLRRGS